MQNATLGTGMANACCLRGINAQRLLKVMPACGTRMPAATHHLKPQAPQSQIAQHCSHGRAARQSHQTAGHSPCPGVILRRASILMRGHCWPGAMLKRPAVRSRADVKRCTGRGRGVHRCVGAVRH